MGVRVTQADIQKAGGSLRKPLLVVGLGLSVVGFVLLAAGLHRLVAAGSASSASSTTPENPLRPADTVEPSSAAQEAPLPPSAKGSGDHPAASGARNPSPRAAGAAATVDVAPGKHPLDPALAEAFRIAAYIRKNVKDYTCVIVKQERIGGTLNPQEFMAAKIRQQPFSVYVKFLRPDSEKGAR